MEDDVVEIDAEHLPFDELGEHAFDEALEPTWCAADAHRHGQVLKEAKLTNESGVLDGIRMHWNLVVCSFHVDL